MTLACCTVRRLNLVAAVAAFTAAVWHAGPVSAQAVTPPQRVRAYAGAATLPSVTVTVAPSAASVQAGASVQFTATVAGTANTGVVWSATGGTIGSGGLYTAGLQAGTYAVKATLVGGTIATSVQVAVTSPAPSLTDSGPLVISGQSGKVYSNLRIKSTSGDCVTIVNSTNITIQNSDIGPCGTDNSMASSRGIRISGSSGVNVYDSYIHVENRASGCCDSHDGILIDNGSSTVTIQGNVIAYGETNIELGGNYSSVSGVSLIGNYLLNPRGPFPRGQNIQGYGSATAFNSNTRVERNYTHSCTIGGGGVPCPSSSGPVYLYSENQEDSVNFGHTNGFVAQANYIVGGHSGSGCGLIADEGANSGQFLSNLLSNTGQCGIGIANGTNHVVDGNKVLNLTPISGAGNTAIYVWNQYSPACGPVTVSNNVADELKTDLTTHSGFWNGGGCGTVTLNGNTFDKAASTILNPMASTNPPPLIPPAPKNCVAVSPYTTQGSLARCY